jgi:hypothetical protein
MQAAEVSALDTVQQFERSFSRAVSFRRADMLPGTLYHYTTAAGLIGIFKSCTMWATNFSFLNDPSEVEYGRKLVLGALDQELKRHSGNARLLLQQVFRAFRKQNVSEVYVTCFTECQDDLSQWRAYGSAAAIRYCIGFDSEAIRQQAWDIPEAVFDRVVYDVTGQRARIQRILDKTIVFVGQHQPRQSIQRKVAASAARRLWRLLPRLKSPAYFAEEEWRVVQWVPSSETEKVNFDPSRGIVRPYVEFGVEHKSRLPVEELIVMAPGREATALKAADMLLLKSELKHVRAAHSKVPFAE